MEGADGEIYTPDMVLGPERRGISVVYATDTRPVPVIAEMAEDADLLVCEGMFGDPEKADRAVEAGHMLFREAARLARQAGVERLWLTHYSPSMKEPTEFFDSEARAIFPNAVLGFDGMHETIRFRED